MLRLIPTVHHNEDGAVIYALGDMTIHYADVRVSPTSIELQVKDDGVFLLYPFRNALDLSATITRALNEAYGPEVQTFDDICAKGEIPVPVKRSACFGAGDRG
jgi:hypothetical protein